MQKSMKRLPNKKHMNVDWIVIPTGHSRYMDCSAVGGSGGSSLGSVIVRYLTTGQDNPLLLRYTPSSGFWEKLSCSASPNTRAGTARLCGRETAAFHISSCLPHSGAMFHTPGRKAVIVGNVSQLDKKS